jgi:hypothetical protein
MKLLKQDPKNIWVQENLKTTQAQPKVPIVLLPKKQTQKKRLLQNPIPLSVQNVAKPQPN